MVLSPEARVGVIATLGLLLIACVVIFLRGSSLGSRHQYALDVVFGRAEGLEEGAEVRISGVEMGRVSGVGLTADNKALAHLELDEGVRLPDSSLFIIKTGTLLGEAYVEVIPRKTEGAHDLRAGAIIKGMDEPKLEDLIPEANALVVEVRRIVRNANTVMSNPQLRSAFLRTVTDIQRTVSQAREIASSVRSLVADPRLKGSALTAAHNLALVSDKAVRIAEEFQKTTKSSDSLVKVAESLEAIAGQGEKEIGAMLSNLRRATEDFQRTSESVRWLATEAGIKEQVQTGMTSLSKAAQNIEGLTGEVRGLVGDKETQEKAKTTVALLQTTAQNLAEATSSLKQLVTDASAQEDLKETLRHTRGTMEHAEKVSERVDKLLAGGPLTKFAKLHAAADFSERYVPGDDRFFADARLKIFSSSRNYWLAGVHDLTEDERLYLEAGSVLDPRTDLRFGIVRSKLGAGVDYSLTPRLGLSLDLYDPNDLTLNLWADYHLNRDFHLMLGVEDAFGESLAGLGLAYGR